MDEGGSERGRACVGSGLLYRVQVVTTLGHSYGFLRIRLGNSCNGQYCNGFFGRDMDEGGSERGRACVGGGLLYRVQVVTTLGHSYLVWISAHTFGQQL